MLDDGSCMLFLHDACSAAAKVVLHRLNWLKLSAPSYPNASDRDVLYLHGVLRFRLRLCYTNEVAHKAARPVLMSVLFGVFNQV